MTLFTCKTTAKIKTNNKPFNNSLTPRTLVILFTTSRQCKVTIILKCLNKT